MRAFFFHFQLNKYNLPEQYRTLVNTHCSGQPGGGFASAVCVGKLIPAIAEAYPNTSTSFVLIPHGLPDFAFNGESGAIAIDCEDTLVFDWGSSIFSEDPNLCGR